MSAERSTHRLFASVVIVAFGLAAVAFVFSWRADPLVVSAALVLLVFAVAVSENFSLEFGASSISLSFPLTIAGVILLGPTASALVAAAGAVSVSDIRRGKPLLKLAYNLACFVLVTLAAAWAYLLAGGRVLLAAPGAQPFRAAELPGALVPLLVVAVVSVIGNVAFVSVGLVLSEGIPFSAILPQLAIVVPNEFALSFVGFLIAQVLAVNLVGLVLFVAPLVVARQVYQRYMQLREAYADIVRSLIGVLEAKDPYTKGHSERVGGYAMAVGEELGLDALVMQRLEYAALLHDIGKIAITRAILVKPSGLTDAEYEAIKRHPVKGAEIVSRIPSLEDIVPFVMSHHEWFDGRGYCQGIRGGEIPALARVLSVADAYDAMTTSRPYRPAKSPEQASEELRRMSGLQFDPEVVDAFLSCDAAYLYSPDIVERMVDVEADVV